MAERFVYHVGGLSCEHCRAAVTQEVGAVPGVAAVEVDLERKTVAVTGSALDDEALRAAIGDAGYEVDRVAAPTAPSPDAETP